SRIWVRAPISRLVEAPSKDRSCGSPPRQACGKIRQPGPTRVRPSSVTCSATRTPAASSTSRPTKENAPTTTSAARTAPSSTWAVGWTSGKASALSVVRLDDEVRHVERLLAVLETGRVGPEDRGEAVLPADVLDHGIEPLDQGAEDALLLDLQLPLQLLRLVLHAIPELDHVELLGLHGLLRHHELLRLELLLHALELLDHRRDLLLRLAALSLELFTRGLALLDRGHDLLDVDEPELDRIVRRSDAPAE